jgi:agmatine/peptidylarginine deiminase
MIKKLTVLVILFLPFIVYSQSDRIHYDQSGLTHDWSPEEWARRDEIGRSFQETTPPEGDIMNVAEFQPMQGVLIRYPLGIPIDLVAKLATVVKVTTIVSSTSVQNTASSYFSSNGVNMNNVDFLIAPTDSYWTRDYGPWYIIDGNEEFGIVDFPYNRPRPNDDDIPIKVATKQNINLFGMNMKHTGGNYMTDGYGHSASTDLVVEENTNMTPAQIQQMAKNYLGVDPYYLINDPLADYIKHIDCWGKFLGVDKVLIGQVSTSDPRYSDYEQTAEWFANTTTAWGNKYRVYRVFSPGGSYASTPYTNSLILNDHVFVPQTGNSYDAQAIISYQQAMPGYTIVPVMQNSSTPWLDTDAIHCRTKGMADLGMLLIKHSPILGEQPNASAHSVYAEITAYSEQPFVEDSMLLFYKINTQEWQSTPLEHISGKTWRGTLPCAENADIAYCFFAKDQSGRREFLPYIGKYDPFVYHNNSGTETLPLIIVDKNEITAEGFTQQDTTLTFTIRNEGCGILTFDISESEATAKDMPLLTFEPQSGQIEPGLGWSIKVTAHTVDLLTGIYDRIIKIESNDVDTPIIEIPFSITLYEGLILSDTIWVKEIENAITYFDVKTDFREAVELLSVNFTAGDVFQGVVEPDGQNLPLSITSTQPLRFKAEYTGTTSISDTIFSIYTFVSDKLTKNMIVAFVPKSLNPVYEIVPENIGISVFPNPAHNFIRFTYNLSKFEPTQLFIYDITGKLIKQFVKTNNAVGQQEIIWNLEKENTNVNGIYIYTLLVGQKQYNGKLVINNR